MVDIEKSLAEFSGAAERLNQKSNNINELIGRVEKRLEAAQAGEFWRTDDHRTQRLAYARSGARWQFLVRVYREPFQDQDEGDAPVLERETPLLQCSREVRIDALQELPGFIDAYRKRIEAMVKAIDEAEESLK